MMSIMIMRKQKTRTSFLFVSREQIMAGWVLRLNWSSVQFRDFKEKVNL